MSGETVFIATCSGRQHTYHTDRECQSIKRATKVVEKDRSVIDRDLRLCRKCAGDVTNPGSQNRGVRNALLEANPEDLGLSPMRSD